MANRSFSSKDFGEGGTEMDDLLAICRSCKIDLFWVVVMAMFSIRLISVERTEKEINPCNFELCFLRGLPYLNRSEEPDLGDNL